MCLPILGKGKLKCGKVMNHTVMKDIDKIEGENLPMGFAVKRGELIVGKSSLGLLN